MKSLDFHPGNYDPRNASPSKTEDQVHLSQLSTYACLVVLLEPPRKGEGSNRGPIGGKKLSDFWVFSWFVNGILMQIWGSNYSQIANYRFLIDSTTFWMDSGTSKMLSKSGPVALPIIIKLLQKTQENMGTFLGNMDLGNLRI